MTFQQVINRFSEQVSLSQTDTAKHLGLSRQVYYNYMSGKTSPSFDDAVLLIVKMGREVAIIMGQLEMSSAERSIDFDSVYSKKISNSLKYSRKAIAEMNRVLPIRKGFHRDHKISISFCRRIDVSPEQASHPLNLEYVIPGDNMEKGATVLINKKTMEHLSSMCIVWEVDIPDDEFIENHNKIVSKTFGKV